MPDQPTIQAQVQESVQPSAELPANATPDAFGAGIGQAFANLGDVATRIHRDAVMRANQTAVLDADNQTNAFLNQRLYDPKTGILYQNTGKDAPGVVDKTLSDFQEHVSKVQSGLVNDEQKTQFQRMSQARAFDLQRQLGEYEHRQTTAYADQTDASAVKLAGDAAVQNAGTRDPELSPDVFIQKQRAIIADAGERKGLPPETIQAQMADAESATHMGVISQLLSTGQDQAGKQWYDEHKEELVGPDRERVARMVDAGSNAGTALRVGDALVAPDAKGQMPDREDLMAKIADMKLSPQARELAENRVNTLLDRHERDVRQGQINAANGAMQILQDPENTLGLNDPRITQARLSMSPAEWAQVQAMGAKDGRVVTDWRGPGGLAYNDFHARITTPATMAAALGEDIPTKYGGILGSGEIKELISLQDSARNELKSGKPDERLASAALVRQIGSDTLLAHGLQGKVDESTPGSPGEPNAKNVLAIQYQTALRRAVDARQALDPKTKITPEIIQQEADKLLIKQTIGHEGPGFFGRIANSIYDHDIARGSDITGYRFQDPKLAATPLAPSEIPKADADAINAQFQARRGRKPRPDEVMALYFRNQESHAAP